MAVREALYPITRNPDGWFAVALSEDLKPGEVKPVTAFGRDLVVFRTESGEARALDAYCIHMGAHLGYGGHVEGECIVCPFHHWKYGPDGRCVDVPYAKKVPPRAAVEPWPVMERNGVITVWHHHLGKEPFCEIPEFSEEGWSEKRWAHLILEMHILDISENGVDVAHFPVVHHCERSGSTMHDPHSIPFRFDLYTSYPGEGIGIPGEQVKVTTEWSYYGPSMFHSISTADDFGMRVRQLFYFTPIEDDKVQFRIGISADQNTIPAELTDFVLEKNEEIALANLIEDSPIWKQKRYLPQPTLCDSDGPLPQLRQWLRQFFPDLAGGQPEVS